MKKIKTLFTVLFLGGLWGFLEATLGTLLHLDAFDSIIFASTAVLLPIAYLICGKAYKLTGKARTAMYVGIVAALIKAVCFFFVPAVNKVVNPMVAIILESSIMAAAFAVTKPARICSIKSFLTFIVASSLVRVSYVGYSMATAVPFQSAYLVGDSIVWNKVVEYIVTMNSISFVYVAVFMTAGVLVRALQKRPNFSKFASKVQHFAYSPVFAIVMITAAIATTILL